MLSVLFALRQFRDVRRSPVDKITLYSDSMYLINGIKLWSKKWKKNGWKKKDGEPVLNQDIWSQIRELADDINLECQHIMGHSGIDLNEKADQLASEMITKHDGLLQNAGG